MAHLSDDTTTTSSSADIVKKALTDAATSTVIRAAFESWLSDLLDQYVLADTGKSATASLETALAAAQKKALVESGKWSDKAASTYDPDLKAAYRLLARQTLGKR